MRIMPLNVERVTAVRGRTQDLLTALSDVMELQIDVTEKETTLNRMGSLATQSVVSIRVPLKTIPTGVVRHLPADQYKEIAKNYRRMAEIPEYSSLYNDVIVTLTAYTSTDIEVSIKVNSPKEWVQPIIVIPPEFRDFKATIEQLPYIADYLKDAYYFFNSPFDYDIDSAFNGNTALLSHFLFLCPMSVPLASVTCTDNQIIYTLHDMHDSNTVYFEILKGSYADKIEVVESIFVGKL